MEDKIKKLLKYSFEDVNDEGFVEYKWLSMQEKNILTEEDYKELINYITN